MADFLTDLTTLMQALGLDVDDVKRGPLTDEGDTGDETALIDYAGVPPDVTYCGPDTRRPRVAVQARRSTRTAACARVEEIYQAFAQVASITAGSTTFHEIIPQSEPSWLDEDANGRTIYTASFEVSRAA